MADFSEEEHFIILLIMLKRTTKLLRQVFRRLWKEETKSEWENATLQNNLTLLDKTTLQHLQYLKSIVKPYRRLEDCDISILTESILCFRRPTKCENEYTAIATIQKIVKDLDSTSSRKISSDDFSTKLEGIRNSLGCLGMEHEDLSMLTAAAIMSSTEENQAEVLLRRAKHNFIHEKKEAEAYEVFKRVAEMDTTSPGETTLYKCNKAVAEAQRCLGTIHATKGNHRDYEKAAFWYEKGMENGSGLAALGMGNLYTKGNGVEVNPDMAEMCYRESVYLRSPQAPISLLKHYLRELELKTAQVIYRLWGSTKPQLCLEMTEEHYMRVVKNKRRLKKMMERQVENFEYENGLGKGRLSFLQRIYRSLRQLYPDIKDVCVVMEGGIFFAHAPHCFAPAHFADTDANVEAQKYQHDVESQTKTLMQLVLEKRCTLLELVQKDGQFEENDKLKILESLYKMLKTGIRLVPYDIMINQNLLEILRDLRQDKRYQHKGEMDEMLTLCYETLSLFARVEVKGSVEMLREGIRRYPDNSIYYSVICLLLGTQGEWKEALHFAKTGLKKDANDVELMFLEAVFFSMLNFHKKPYDCVAKYKVFIERAPNDDPTVPDAWFAKAGLHLQTLEKKKDPTEYFRVVAYSMRLVEQNFKEGLKAEELQLPCFLPYKKSGNRFKVELSLELWKSNGRTRTEAESSLACLQGTAAEHRLPIFDRKIYLKSPTRKGLIILHRKNIKDKIDGTDDSMQKPGQNVETADLPKLQQSLTEDCSSLKPIFLQGMNPTVEHIFKNRFLELIFLVEPDLNSGLLASVAEDKNGNVIRVHVYNFQDEDNITEKFSVGSRIAVMEPYLSMTTSDLHSCIRIDDLRSVIYQRKVKNMCGFCGEEDSSHHCSKCQRIYCSVECEDLDVERHGHSLICS